MKSLLVALASASLLTAGLASVPTQAVAQAHGGGRGGGGFHGGGGGGGGYHGGGGGGHYGGGGGHYGGGGYHGGGHYYGGGGRYYGGRYYGGGYYAPYYAGALGFALGSAYAAPWYYDYPPPYYTYGYPAPPPDAYDDDDGAPPPPQACGAWSWDASQSSYFWTPCAAPGAAAAGPPVAGRVAPAPPR